MRLAGLWTIGLLMVLLSLSAQTSQTPPAFNYQAIARYAAGNPLPNRAVALRLGILNDSAAGNLIYSETFSTLTNKFGLFTVNIGAGAVVAGVFSQINWAAGSKWLKVELDMNGGSSFLYMATTQLLSVPYALYAANSGFTNNLNTSVSVAGDTLYVGNTYYIIPGMSTANACRSDFLIDTVPYTRLFPHAGENPYDVATYGLPGFILNNYIELDKIDSISRFRSGAGHDYSDSYESCRSMKHYYHPDGNIDWTTVKIFAPVNGTIISSAADSIWGQQIAIAPFGMPAFAIILFHVNPTVPFNPGDSVRAGAQIGTHSSNQTTSDIAVRINAPGGNQQLVSYFDVMNDKLFSCYMLRGVTTRDAMIISKAARDADPLLPCNGNHFFYQGTIPNWVVLH